MRQCKNTIEGYCLSLDGILPRDAPCFMCPVTDYFRLDCFIKLGAAGFPIRWLYLIGTYFAFIDRELFRVYPSPVDPF